MRENLVIRGFSPDADKLALWGKAIDA